MPDLSRPLSVLTDGESFSTGAHFRLEGKTAIGLFPSLFLLQCWNLPDTDALKLSRAKNLTVLRDDSRLAFGRISDVFRQTVPEGTITTAAFSLGLDLWETQISVSIESGATVSDTVRRLLTVSGTGISLLSMPGHDPVVTRGPSFFGRAAECVETALSAASARCYLTAAGLCVVPKDPLPVRLRLSEKDLLDLPAYVDAGRKVILRTTVTGFQPGEELELPYGRQMIRGLILERAIEADNVDGPWRTELLVEVHL